MHALSYAVQQTSGVPYWRRDSDHIEKAFDFAGIGARNGTMAALMVQSGWTGVEGVMTGAPSFLSAFAETARPEALTDGLGTRFEIMEAAIKKWCVGSPIQAALDSLMQLITDHRIGPRDVVELRAIMPDDRLHIVDGRDMPDVCLQHLLAICLIDGDVGFAAAHDRARMSDPAVLALRQKIKAIPSKDLTEARPPRQAIIEIDTKDGRHLRHHTRAVLGTPANPMRRDQVVDKARDLILADLGAARTEALIDAVLGIDAMPDIRGLRALLALRS